MFEKEAEEYAEKHAFRIPYDGSDKFYDDKDYECSKEGFQKGAEFGYNKGKNEAKEIIQQLIANAPNTYSGTDIELQQKKMFSFQNAVNKAEQFLKDTE